jgi:predicted transposase YbfD/YdcC
VADGQVKLFAAMLQEEKAVIAQHRSPDDTNEITQVRELLDPVDLKDAVVTADAAHAQHDTAAYIGGERESDYLLTVKGNQPGLQRAIYEKISSECGGAPDHVSMDYGHGRIIRRSIWVTGADGIDFPHAAWVLGGLGMGQWPVSLGLAITVLGFVGYMALTRCDRPQRVVHGDGAAATR